MPNERVHYERREGVMLWPNLQLYQTITLVIVKYLRQSNYFSTALVMLISYQYQSIIDQQLYTNWPKQLDWLIHNNASPIEWLLVCYLMYVHWWRRKVKYVGPFLLHAFSFKYSSIQYCEIINELILSLYWPLEHDLGCNRLWHSWINYLGLGINSLNYLSCIVSDDECEKAPHSP